MHFYKPAKINHAQFVRTIYICIKIAEDMSKETILLIVDDDITENQFISLPKIFHLTCIEV